MSFSKKVVICLTKPKMASKGYVGCVYIKDKIGERLARTARNVQRHGHVSAAVRVDRRPLFMAYLQEDPNTGTEKGDWPGNKHQKEDPDESKENVFGHGGGRFVEDVHTSCEKKNDSVWLSHHHWSPILLANAGSSPRFQH